LELRLEDNHAAMEAAAVEARRRVRMRTRRTLGGDEWEKKHPPPVYGAGGASTTAIVHPAPQDVSISTAGCADARESYSWL
jgi:hypothetical protein